jgi:homoserine kinase type II
VEIAEDLVVLSEAFGIGEVHACRFLPAGLMNGNWQLDTTQGVFALKRIVDVPLPDARRNLEVLQLLDNAGIPVGRPKASADGDKVVEVADRGYSLVPWLEGTHLPGTTLTLDQAGDLGTLLGQIHQALNNEQAHAFLSPAQEADMAAPVRSPAAAHREADRLLALVASLESPTAFDTDVAVVLGARKVLLDKYSDHRPRTEVAVGPIGWTHGDVQYRNVLWRDGKIAGVIDWDRIRIRPLGEEVARTATVQFAGEDGLLDLERTAAFVSGYRSVVSIPVPALADAVERLWWKRMSDYWQLVFHYDRDDRSCDDLFLPGEKLLAWWTTRREDVQQAFAATP